ncbi:MAG: gliding motility-associated C-terminal domain-containing protein, partial [Bacteroidetes bacterium]|nr:gliding motility-associated C-terminal domain-containing protein [Bacteroidota bacterium]
PYTEYSDTGAYSVTLVTRNTFGCSDTVTKPLYVAALPVIDVSDTTLLCKGESTTLTVVQSPGLTYTWNSGETTASITVAPDETTEYSVTDSYGCTEDYLVYVDQGMVEIPTAFSPNGDGQNDLLYVAIRDVKELTEFSIYNRWGQLLFSTTDKNAAWDGTYNGKPQNVDTYVYIVKALTNCGKEVNKKGYITLLR